MGSIYETQLINTVLALDCAYHFPSRKKFLADSFKLLVSPDKTRNSDQKKAVIGLTDIVLASDNLSWGKGLLLQIMLKLSNIPKENTVTLEEYENQLKIAGFSNIISKDISQYVLPLFGQSLNKRSFKTLIERRSIERDNDKKLRNEKLGNERHKQLVANSIESPYRYKIKNPRALWLKYKVTAVFLTWAYKRGVLRYIVICGVKDSD